MSAETLLRWRPVKRGRVYGLQVVTDPADFDVDPDTEERYPRIVGFWISSPKKRGVEFCWGTKDYPSWPRYVVGTGKPRFLPAPPVRVTRRGFSWDYTPDHVPVLPGSVSTPSLLTSGGTDTPDLSNDVTAAFTPTTGSLLVVGWSCQTAGTTATTYTYTNTHVGSGAWAAVESVLAGTSRSTQSQARCQMGASPGSGAITNTYGGADPGRTSWIVAEVTGHNTTTPLSESNTGGAGTGTTLSVAVAAIAAGNLVIGTSFVRGTAAIDPGDGSPDPPTELAEATSGGTAGGVVRTQMEYSTTQIAMSWTWVGSDRNAGVAVEYAAAPAAVRSRPPPTPWRRF